MRQPTPESAGAAIAAMRLIGLAMGAGVTLFAAVVWMLHRDTPPPQPPAPALLYLWIAIATSLAAASMVLWRGKVVPLIEGRAGGDDWRGRARSLQTGVIVTWAIVEAAALFGVVLYFLQGHGLAGALGVAMMWAAVLLTWPREEWLPGGDQAASRSSS